MVFVALFKAASLAHDVALRDDADGAIALSDDETIDAILLHGEEGLIERCVGRSAIGRLSSKQARHGLAGAGHLAIRKFSKKIAATDHADQAVTIDDGEHVNVSLEQQAERVANAAGSRDGHDLPCHDVAREDA